MVLTRRQSHRRGNDEDSLTELPMDKSMDHKTINKPKRNPGKPAISSDNEKDQSVEADVIASDTKEESSGKVDTTVGQVDSEDDSQSEDDEDIDALLDKAEEALRMNNDSQQPRLPKLDAGISVKDQLYIVNNNNQAKIAHELAVLNDGGEGSSNTKALNVLKASKSDVPPVSRKDKQKEKEATAGKGWFDMPKTEITPEIKRDLQVIRLRNVLDRKRHYKKSDSKDPTYFQVGTVIEGPTEFFSSRLTKRERKQTIVDELLADDEARGYYKRRFLDVQSRTQNGGKKHFKKVKGKRAQKW
ncbi:Fcf2 pre-rRNA processing-domain-containing protein [Umbelopsis sp. AD052]|nr:Fcf2 pre-rRNA processing-domain-containing protein [Umbelopsis sp. AD052]